MNFALLLALTLSMDVDAVNTRRIVDFRPGEEVSWRIVNDSVMGGRSQSEMSRVGDHRARFAGTLSLENNGGFASVRGLVEPLDLREFDRFALRVRGDGRRYQLRIRSDGRLDGVAYRREFETIRDAWIVVEIDFAALEPSFRGRVLKDWPPLDLEAIKQIGLLLGDKKPGPFALEIDWIEVRGGQTPAG